MLDLTGSQRVSGTYKLYAHDNAAARDPQTGTFIKNADASDRHYGIRILDASAPRAYWIGYRRHTDWSGNPSLVNGVEVVRSAAGKTQLLDTTPETPDNALDAPLVFGRTLVDDTAKIQITPIQKVDPNAQVSGDEYVEVRVNFFDGPNQPPTATISANSTTVPVDAAVSFTATAQDADDTTLAYSWDFEDVDDQGRSTHTFGGNAPLRE